MKSCTLLFVSCLYGIEDICDQFSRMFKNDGRVNSPLNSSPMSTKSFLAKGATCVTLGWSTSPEVTIDVRDLIITGRTTLYGLNMFEEFNRRDGSEDLAWLAQMVAEQKLQTPIEVEASWHEIGNVAQPLLQRQHRQSCSAS
jgi:hypothetical protein